MKKYIRKIYVNHFDKLLETYSFYLEGKPATKEEIIDAIAFIKAKREIRKELLE
jgi:hypothetical protein